MKSAIMIVVGFTLLGAVSCGDKTPPKAPPKVVKQIISTPSPSSDEKAAVSVSTAAKKAPEANPTQSTTPVSGDTSASMAAGDLGTPSDLIQETLQVAATYDPKGRIDPFEPLFQEKPTVEVETVSKDKPKRRIPQTPLEKVALSQLKLTAVIRAPSGNRGLVVDATGKGYVVEEGTYIGLNSGRVIQIANDRIVVEENIENIMGVLTVNKSELKLQKPAGEL